MLSLGQTVRGCSLTSTAVRGDCHSYCHSATREPVVSGCWPRTLSKSVGVCSRQVSAVYGLELRPGPVLGGRSRTSANETRTGTGAVFVPKGFQEGPRFTARRRRYLLLSVLRDGSPSMIIPRVSRAQSGRTRPGAPASPGAPGVADGPRCHRDWAAARTFTVISGG